MSFHYCYILQSESTPEKFYIGYTVDMSKRIRQHNGNIVGGAKKTCNNRPWKILCTIHGFYDNTSALRFEYRLQRMTYRKKLFDVWPQLIKLVVSGDGSLEQNNKIPWPILTITWYNLECSLPHVINNYKT
jgi:predicted GIY-YIG superfamily endonuclease